MDHENDERNDQKDGDLTTESSLSVIRAKLLLRHKAEKIKEKSKMKKEASLRQEQLEMESQFGAARGKKNWKNVKSVMETELTLRERDDSGARLLGKTEKMLGKRIQQKAAKKIEEMKRMNSNHSQDELETAGGDKGFVPNSAYFHALQNTPSPLMQHWGQKDRSLETFAAGQRSRLTSSVADNDVNQQSSKFLSVASQAMGAKRRQHSIEDVVAFKEWQAFHIKQCSDFKQKQTIDSYFEPRYFIIGVEV